MTLQEIQEAAQRITSSTNGEIVVLARLIAELAAQLSQAEHPFLAPPPATGPAPGEHA